MRNEVRVLDDNPRKTPATFEKNTLFIHCAPTVFWGLGWVMAREKGIHPFSESSGSVEKYFSEKVQSQY